MAKKKPNLNIFAKTAAPAAAAADEDKKVSFGVTLKASEWAEIESLAASLSMKRGPLAVSLLRYGLQALKAGKIKTKTSKTLDL